MLVSTRPATSVKLFPAPAAILRGTARLALLSHVQALGGLVEVAQTLLGRQDRAGGMSGNDGDRRPRGDDLDLIADADAIVFRQPLGQRDLQFPRYPSHGRQGI